MEPGAKFNRLMFVEMSPIKTGDGHKKAIWQCQCGNTKEISVSRVKNGYTRSCGCLSMECKPNLSHGMKGTGTYHSWTAAKDRSTNKNSKDWHRYGGAGIGMCARWMIFDLFLEDMGEKPEGCSLERVDNTKGYEPGNCIWADRSTQARNTKKSRIWSIKGRLFETLKEAAEFNGVTETTVSRWVYGAFDKRRNSRITPRGDCYAISKY